MRARRPKLFSPGEILDLYESGKSPSEVAKKLNCSKSTVYKAIRACLSSKTLHAKSLAKGK